MHEEQHDGKTAEQEPSRDRHPSHPPGEYPLGRGYGHDYMRGGEVFGGYGYSARPEYEQRRGERTRDSS